MNVIGQVPVGLGIDPNTSRLIEETVAILNEVDQRLTALKVGISHAMPQLANVLLWKEQLAFTNPLARTGGLGAHLGVGTPFLGQMGIPQAGLGSLGPYAGIPSHVNPAILAQLSPFLGQSFFGSPVSPFVPQAGLGVATPFGTPFRPY